MCGILGIVDRRTQLPDGSVRIACDAMAHRGPDDKGEWYSQDRHIGLGHRRLAIMDLSPRGHQPMHDSLAKITITFNGEIYNFIELRVELAKAGHKFLGGSDTEVILAAYRQWGSGCVARLKGMFAFAIVDQISRTLLLARDRAGEKPLFYTITRGGIRFASELKALILLPDVGRTIDIEALHYYLAFGYVPSSKCILRGVHKLPQGHLGVFDLNTGNLSVQAYWSIPDQQPFDGDEGSLEKELERLFRAAVERQMVADVPVGILLSGGVDSSLVVAMAAQLSPKPVKTFTVSFPGHRAFDESGYARTVAQHFKTDHLELTAENADVSLLPMLARQFDEPLADSSMIPTFLVCRLIRQHAAVALGGDGGDELFGGYSHYKWIQQHARVQSGMPQWTGELISAAASRFMPVGVRGRNYLLGLSRAKGSAIEHVNLFFDVADRKRVLDNRGGYQSPSVDGFKSSLTRKGDSLLRQAMIADFKSYLPDDILAKVDRASMLSSLEVRAPWLDADILDFAFSRVPDHLRCAGGRAKILPKRIASRLLPSSLNIERKQGFAIPLSSWLEGPWGEFMGEVLLGSVGSIFSKTYCRSLIASQSAGRANSQRLFSLIMFELWRREYKVTL